ncbi:MAG: ABC transporter ATP-binding protein [Alphaproteobacteria bacterium]|nr:ABC transporter ATP-binding protein [Alphaproteobacteria bacterium]
MANPALLSIDDLMVGYRTRRGGITAVERFSLTLGEGEALGLVGESGCGKTTVALAIMRYLGRNGRVTGGTIRFRGQDVAGFDEARLRRYRGGEVAMVYQEPMSALNPSMTIGHQLAEVAALRADQSAAAARAAAHQVLADVQIADADRTFRAYPHQLSGGQQQRAMIAMALLSRPALLLLDEPTTALDVTIEAGIIDLIRAVQRRYRTGILFVSHNLGLVNQVCDRVAVMYAGEAVEVGDVATVLHRPRHPYTAGLINCLPNLTADKQRQPLRPIPGQLPAADERYSGCRFGPRCAHRQPARCDQPIVLAAISPGQAVRCVRAAEIEPLADAAPGPAVGPGLADRGDAITTTEVRKDFRLAPRTLAELLRPARRRRLRANDAVSLRVGDGETLAIVGESGSGKSTIARIVAGLLGATAGSVRLLGEEVGNVPAGRRDPRLRAALQMIFQDPNDTLNPSHSIGRQLGRAVRRLAAGSLDAGAVAARVSALLELVRLPTSVAERLPHQLSGGQRQRIGIARAFAGSPRAVLADEPVSALDVSVQAAIIDLLLAVQRQSGTALVYISHNLALVRYLADRVAVMYLGRIVEIGTTAEVFAPPYHPYTEALLSAIPAIDVGERTRIVLTGPPPNATARPEGCAFHPRCPRYLGEICRSAPPPEQSTADGHRIACHIPLPDLAAAQRGR